MINGSIIWVSPLPSQNRRERERERERRAMDDATINHMAIERE
jgi:hypothetical protein